MSAKAYEFGLRRKAPDLFARAPLAGRIADRLRRIGNPIFMFHRVLPKDERCYDPEMATSLELFSGFLDWVLERYHVVPVEELIRLSRSVANGNRPPCSLTFDDGWRDNFVHAFPLLQKHGLPATIFLPVRFIGSNRRFWQEKLGAYVEELAKRGDIEGPLSRVVESFPWCPRLECADMAFGPLRRLLLRRSSWEAEAFVDRLGEAIGSVPALEGRAFLNWEEVRMMQEAGLLFGSHTLSHTLLTRADPTTAYREILESRRELAARLGTEPAGFSYPWGAASPRIERQAREAGYEFALTAREKLVQDCFNRWALPRLPVSTSYLSDGGGRVSAGRVNFYIASRALPSKVIAPPSASSETDPLRIAFVIDSLDSWEDGGTERQIGKFIEALDPAYFAVQLYFLCPSRSLTAADFPCPVHIAASKPPGAGMRIRTLARLTKLFRQQQPHIVQTFFRDATYYGVTAAKLAGVPVVVAARRNLGHWKTFVDRMALRLINRMTDAWQCNSRAVAESLENDEGVPPDRIEILPNAIDLARFSPATPGQRARACEQLGLQPAARLCASIAPRGPIPESGVPAAGLVLVSVATLFAVKDPMTLVEAAALVCRELPQAQFILVGEGPLRGALEVRIKELGLSNKVHLAGAQSNIRPYLAAADIGLLTSRSEGSSNAILEYAAMGLPVVASDLQANRELVRGSFFKAANVTDLTQKILRLSADGGLRARMGEENRKRAMEYSNENFASRAQSYYARLAADFL